MTRAERNSWRTAVKRSKPSAPARWLYANGHLSSHIDILDYGCGRGDDVKAFGNGLNMVGWDPHFSPEPHYGTFSVILCTYVLNTLPKARENAILGDILDRLRISGVAYITVRRNVRKPGYTTKGTYQRNVKLRLPVVHETSDYCIYRMTRGVPV